NGVTGARLAVQLHAGDCAGGDAEALDVALRQLTLVEDHLKSFLDLGRADGLAHRLVSLDELVGEAVTLLRPQCRQAGTDLGWRPPETPVVVPGDAGRLRQVLHNLLGNALEAAGPGGWVGVQLRQAEGKYATLEVSDSGPGPPAALADRLFEPF